MTAIWYLLVLAPFIVIPILWWSHRRKAAERDSAADARWRELVSAAKADPAVTQTATPVTPTAARAGYARRARTLDPVQTVLYYLLKNGLPDHEVMPQVVLASVLEVPAEVTGSEREQRLRSLTQHTVDFVICNKALQPVAVIELTVHEPTARAPAEDFKTGSLAAAGIRHLRLSRKELPKREAVRSLVLGG